MQINWLWLVGFIPYNLQWQHTKDELLVRVKALFWRLVIRHQGRWSWKLDFPLIEHWPPEQ